MSDIYPPYPSLLSALRLASLIALAQDSSFSILWQRHSATAFSPSMLSTINSLQILMISSAALAVNSLFP